MNSREIQLIEYLIGDDKLNMNCAMEKMFFAPKGQMMCSFQKAAFDAVQRKFNGSRYAQFSVKEKYDTAMSSGVIDKLIAVLRKDKISFLEQNAAESDSLAPTSHWTSQYKNFNGYLGIVIEREVNKKRAYIDSILGLEPECISSVSLDDSISNDKSKEENDLLTDFDDNKSDTEKLILISSLYEGIANLKHEKDKDIIQSILIGGMSDEEYAKSRGMDINALYRDKARARDRLIIEMIATIQRTNKALVRKYSYLIDDESRELVFDIVLRENSFQDVAKVRCMSVSDVRTRFSSAYSKIIKNHNAIRSEYLDEIAKDENKLMRVYARHLSRLAKMGATTI